MGMSISGLTGYDWSSVIDGLVNVEKKQLTALETQQEKNNAKSDIYGQLSTYMTAVSDAAYSLRYLGGNALGQVSSESSNTSVATLKASSGVTSLSATLNVLSLPTAAQVKGTEAIYAGTGSKATAATAASAADIRSSTSFSSSQSLASQAGYLNSAAGSGGTFSVNGTSFSWSSSDSLDTLLGKVNAAGLGVTATYDSGTGKVSLATTATGTSATLTLDETAGSLFSALGLSKGSTSGTAAQSFSPSLALGSSENHIDTGVIEGTFTINNVKFTFPPSSTSLNQAIESINNSAAGVVASYDSASGVFSIKSKDTGSGAQLVLGAAGDTSNFLQAMKVAGATVTAGADGQVQVNGGATQSVSSTTSTGLVPGATVTLKGTGITSLSVGSDTATAESAVQALVDAYNTAVDYINTKTSEEIVKSATTVDDQLKGMFNGDSTFLDAKKALNQMVNDNYSMLSKLGVTLGSYSSGKALHLQVDSAAFEAAFEENPQGVQDKLSSFVEKMYTQTKAQSSTGTGSIYLEQKSLAALNDTLDNRIEQMTLRIDKYKATLTAEYTQMETLLSNMESKSKQINSIFGTISSSLSTSNNSSSTSSSSSS